MKLKRFLWVGPNWCLEGIVDPIIRGFGFAFSILLRIRCYRIHPKRRNWICLWLTWNFLAIHFATKWIVLGTIVHIWFATAKHGCWSFVRAKFVDYLDFARSRGCPGLEGRGLSGGDRRNEMKGYGWNVVGSCREIAHDQMLGAQCVIRPLGAC